ncbi:MAG: response regulator [Flavisolibacter sp.]|nr:response regulator [Flavisolibacter sp.]
MEHIQKIILYVDDDADDREFLSAALKEVNPAVDIVFAENGLKALDYLNAAKDNNSQLPCLIVLDLNLPYLDGRETFKKIKNDERLQSVPIIVFTSSMNPNDKKLFNNLGIEFITKPDNIAFMNNIASRMLVKCAL